MSVKRGDDRRGRSPRPSPRGDRRRSGGGSRSKPRKADNESSSVEASPGSWNVERGRSRVRRPSNTASDEPQMRRRGYHSLFSSFGKVFYVERRWKLIREMGSGAYGTVISAADEISGETVAIKQVTRVFDKIQLAKRALREVTLLRHFANHENITGLIDLDAISPDFNEIYIFMEPMEADLHQIIKSGQSLTNEHVQYFLYQILRGMKYVHSAAVVHRDLKPGNLLVNADCELKICDFGLSRGFDQTPDDNAATHMTEYVATRWYRAPEIMLAFRRYNTAIDVWSIGCILAELLLGKPLFKGKDYVDQLNKILDVLGTPDDAVVSRIASDRAQAYLRSLPVRKPKPFHSILPTADPQAIDLLERMLSFDPAARITVPEALAHPWLASYHDVEDEPECPHKFEKWRMVEELETIEQFREALWSEIQDYRQEARSVLPPSPVSSRSEHSPAVARAATSASPHATRTELPLVPEEAPLASPANIPEKPATPAAVESVRDSAVSLSRAGSLTDRKEADPMLSYARRSSFMRTNSSHGPGYSTYHPTSTAQQYRAMPSFEVGRPSQPLPRPTSIGEPPVVLGVSPPRQTQGQAPAGGIPFPSYIVPARTRTVSVAGGMDMARRLLRTLSTVSIHETGEGLPGGLAEVAPIGRYIVERKDGEVTEADQPPSELPQELASSEGSGGSGSGKGSGGKERRKGGRKFTLGE